MPINVYVWTRKITLRMYTMLTLKIHIDCRSFRSRCVLSSCCAFQFRFDEGDGKGRRERGRPGEMKEVPLITRLQDRELQEMRDEGQSCDYHGNTGWVT